MTTKDAQAWMLSIDFGTTTTAGAVSAAGRDDLVRIDDERRMPSMVCWKEGSNGAAGRLLLGDEAENEAAFSPERLERCPKRKLGQDFMLLGSERVRVTDAIGQIFKYVLDEEMPRHGGNAPRELRLTHPARWGEKRLARLREAAGFAGFDEPLLVPEPVGAAVYFAEQQLSPGDHVAVYDLGGGTFDTAVLRRTTAGFEVVGKPGGRDDLGGEDFDDRLYQFLGEQLDPEQWQTLTSPDAETVWRRAHFDFKRDVRRAKERLSRNPDAKVRTPIPGAPDVQVSVSDFESLIRDKVDVTVHELDRTISAAGQSVANLSAIYLAGGSSQIPLVVRRIEEVLGKTPSKLGDPKGVVALGACRVNVGASTQQSAVTEAAPVAPPAPAPPTQAPPPREAAPARQEAPAPPAAPPPKAPPPPVAKPPLPVFREAPSHRDERAPAPAPTATVGAMSKVGGAIAVAGAVVLIVSLFLDRLQGFNAWSPDFLPKRYPIALTALAVLCIGLVAAGLRFSRQPPFRLPSYMGAFAIGSTFPLVYFLYRSREVGFWLGVGGAVLITVGAVIAAPPRVTPRERDAGPTPAGSPRAWGIAAGLGLALLIVSLFLPYDGRGNAWTTTIANRYPLIMAALAAVTIALIALEARTGRVPGLGIAATASAFMLGEAFVLVFPSFEGLKAGFWLAVAGALVALVASAVPVIAQDIADARPVLTRGRAEE